MTGAGPQRDEFVTGSDAEHPFRGLRSGWHPVARPPRGRARRAQTCVEIVLDPERSAWVLEQAARAGLDFETYVYSLIDAARTADRAGAAAT